MAAGYSLPRIQEALTRARTPTGAMIGAQALQQGVQAGAQAYADVARMRAQTAMQERLLRTREAAAAPAAQQKQRQQTREMWADQSDRMAGDYFARARIIQDQIGMNPERAEELTTEMNRLLTEGDNLRQQAHQFRIGAMDADLFGEVAAPAAAPAAPAAPEVPTTMGEAAPPTGIPTPEGAVVSEAAGARMAARETAPPGTVAARPPRARGQGGVDRRTAAVEESMRRIAEAQDKPTMARFEMQRLGHPRLTAAQSLLGYLGVPPPEGTTPEQEMLAVRLAGPFPPPPEPPERAMRRLRQESAGRYRRMAAERELGRVGRGIRRERWLQQYGQAAPQGG